ncbi:hypothetical protein RHMOL_Rhmol06G0118200 [Rhododendron molle]|uniref:Uncharacterized protein n=1 Tax=Rhododendron molle TaxID=49168 RepID=A0ACC0NBC1_RHOML|nr:hypothetical protein RHMOL_Rhmol06G0118200 [Rhododendron molle]
MADQPFNLESVLTNLQNSLTTMQQRATKIDADIAHLNDLINIHLPSVLEEEGEDDKDVHEEPIFISDPNHEGRIVVQPVPREARIPSPNSNQAGGRLAQNPEMAALIAKMAKLEQAVSKYEKIRVGGMDLDCLYVYANARLPDRFKMPDLVKFDGSGDPKTHLFGYHAAMKLLGVENKAMS